MTDLDLPALVSYFLSAFALGISSSFLLRVFVRASHFFR